MLGSKIPTREPQPIAPLPVVRGHAWAAIQTAHLSEEDAQMPRAPGDRGVGRGSDRGSHLLVLRVVVRRGSEVVPRRSELSQRI